MTRTTTWTNIGTDVKGAADLNEVLKLAGLDYSVSTRPLEVNVGLKTLQSVPDKIITINDNNHEVLGIVGKNYSVCQNADAFDFVNYIDSDIKFEKAGQTHSGMVYIIASLPEMNILGDQFIPYVIFQNGHNGHYTVKTTICPLRIVCQNQFNYSFGNFDNTISMRHNSTLEAKMIDAKEILSKTAEYMTALNNDMQKLASQKIDEKNLYKVVEAMFPIMPDMKDSKKEKIMEQRKVFENAYFANDNQNFRRTLMGLVNAEADYLTHRVADRKAPTYDERKFLSVTFDPKAMNKFITVANSIVVA